MRTEPNNVLFLLRLEFEESFCFHNLRKILIAAVLLLGICAAYALATRSSRMQALHMQGRRVGPADAPHDAQGA